jgi:chromosome partitioning protein
VEEQGMANVITVMNMKGGVGKTVVSTHLAGTLALYDIKGKRRKVLAIDYDAQFNMSQMYLPTAMYSTLDKARKTSLAILQDDETMLNPYELQVPGNLKPPKVEDLIHPIYPLTSGGLLDIIPSTLDLMYVALGQTSARTDPLEERFQKFIAECRKNYDVIIIDCHPAGSILTKTALRNANHVIIPVTPTPFASRGVSLMVQFVDSVKTGTKGAQPHILFNAEGKHPSSSQNDIRSNPHFSKHCVATPLRWFKAFSDPVGGENFVWYSGRPHSGGARTSLLTVADDLVGRLGL